MRANPVWGAYYRCDLTLSLPGAAESERAARAAADELTRAECGYTHTRGIGGWNGGTEFTHCLSVVSDCKLSPEVISDAVCAATREGCQAVQVERWDGSPGARASYRASEWRAEC